MNHQDFADNVTNAVMGYFFGDEFHNCDDITENHEMNHAWEFINEVVFEELSKL